MIPHSLLKQHFLSNGQKTSLRSDIESSSINTQTQISISTTVEKLKDSYLFFFFLVALGLRCCAWAFSSCGEGVYSSLWCAGFSLQWLLLLWSTGSRHTGFSSCGMQAQQLWLTGSRAQAQQLWCTGSVALRQVGSSQTRARTRVPCIGRQILYHCATREAPVYLFF